MSVHQMTHDTLLTTGQRVIDLSKTNPVIADAVEPYGYDAQSFEGAQALLDAYAESVRLQETELGEQMAATEAVNEAWDAFHERTYMPHVTIARVVYPDRGDHRRMHIDGERPQAFDAYLQEARRFYTTIHDSGDLAAGLRERGITSDDVETALSDFYALEALEQTQETEKAETQQTTRRRNDLRRPFANWLADHLKIAAVALADHPDQLEQLSVRTSS